MARALADTAAEAALLAASVEKLFGVLRKLNPRDGLSLTAASTLRRLEHQGAHRLTDLAAAEGVTQPAMTQLVSRLERERLVSRGGDPADGRVVVVSVTAAGRAAGRKRRTGRVRALSVALKGLSPADRAALAAAAPALDRLAELVDLTGEG
jgi:DNA-binding MarR family transcriptional regulator